ncbi:hypothetical protein C6P46_001337, partial [Rhodotorula mucilaginosa]
MGSVSPSLTLAISRFGIDPQRGFKRSSVANASLCTYGLVTSSVRSTFLSCVPGTPRVRGVNEISKQFLATVSTRLELECKRIEAETPPRGELGAARLREPALHACRSRSDRGAESLDAMAPSPPKPWETQQGGGGGATSAALSSSSTTTGIHPATSPATASSGDHGAPALPDRPSSMST